MRHVRCTTPECVNRGIVRDVPVMRIARGVVGRVALHCDACGMAVADMDQPPSLEAAVVAAPENTAARTGRPRSR